MRVAIVHDWLTGMRGGERCLEVFCELFPDADLVTLLHVKGRMSPTIERMNIRTSFVQWLPFAESKYRNYLPFFPRAIESLDFSGYDFILSSSHCVAKGATPRSDALHVCYCYTPMRYVWDLYDEYFGPDRVGWLKGKIIARCAKRLRAWDAASSERVHHFVAISRHVAERIKRHYGRESDVICPPVDCAMFAPSERQGDYFLIVSALAPYKRVDPAVEAFNRLGLKLKIVGAGPEAERLKALAEPNVEFLGWQSDEALRGFYAECRALIFPGEEDFGITPLEAMASGRPVIAYGKGGALETVVAPGGLEPPTGLFFREQTADALVEAVRQFERLEGAFSKADLRAHALKFDRPIFKQKVDEYVKQRLAERQARR